MTIPDNVFTSSEVAHILGKFPSVISRLCKEGKINSFKKGKFRYIDYTSLAVWGGSYMARQVKAGVLFIRVAPWLIDKIGIELRKDSKLNPIVTTAVCARCIEEQPNNRKELETIIKEEWQKC